MKLDELWVGDEVVIKSSGKRGKFIGIIEGKARIQLKDKVVRVKAQNLDYYKEEKIHPKLNDLYQDKPPIKSKSSIIQASYDFSTMIDLHMEVLQPEKKHDNPVAILEFQLRKLKEFMDEAVSLRIPKVSIIHGKGTGALRMEVYHLLNGYPEKQSLYPINNDGGVDVYLTYN